MNFGKPPFSLSDQIAQLEHRGLRIADKEKATNFLSNISYYRLRAYTYPFQNNANPSHEFVVDISFEEIIGLYVFDRKMRLLVFDGLEKIEVALRTKIVYYMAMAHGSHWHETAALYRSNSRFVKHISKMYEEIDRSAETFIDHYKSKYFNPAYPPAWMSLEVVSMGVLSKLYENLHATTEKKAIARAFGLPHVRYLENWMLAFASLRNVCAHHGRLWNRRFTSLPELPDRPLRPFLTDTSAVYRNKLYAVLSCMCYILRDISPEYNFAEAIKNLIGQCQVATLHDMGFPEGWEKEPVWKN